MNDFFDVFGSMSKMMSYSGGNTPDPCFKPLSSEDIEKLKKCSVGFKENCRLGGYQYNVVFKNGYAADIVKHCGSYGHEHNLWEIAVMKNNDIVYDTDITNDVLGFLDDDEVMDTCRKISLLDENGKLDENELTEFDLMDDSWDAVDRDLSEFYGGHGSGGHKESPAGYVGKHQAFARRASSSQEK